MPPIDSIDAIPRDRWGRPLLEVEGSLIPFTRASTLSNAIENTRNLELWKMRMTAAGMASRPDLVAKALAKGEDKSTMNDIVKSAMETAESNKGANLGTAVHSFCEMIDQGQSLPKNVDLEIRKSLRSYLRAIKQFDIIAVEQFVGARSIKSAGTFDRLVSYQGNLYIADIKTAATAPDYAHSASVQMAVYANGTPYSVEDKWASESLADKGVSQDKAIIIHLPQDGSYRADFYWVDIKTGWKYARVAVAVRDWWKNNPCEPLSSAL